MTKETKERLRDLIDECHINFEGPVPQKQWPDQYRHLFSVIRKICATRYDEYVQRQDSDPSTIRSQRARVWDLRKKASGLRKDRSINEATWREVEMSVFGRFGEQVICHHCKHERWNSDYVAEPVERTEQARLQRKRTKREACQCLSDTGSTTYAYDESDDEYEGPIFKVAIGDEVKHDPDDRFDKRGIPMRPDRVVGLAQTRRFQNDVALSSPELTHCPVSGADSMLYPFLVLEAKREDGAPGFRAVERQTAFPLRRFLKLQDALQRACSKNLEPLVWFFAYQGELWRLYAGTLVNANLRVYDLWLGTIESQDGALQLLQIVDFIWTWARDIYRRQIRCCLRGNGISGRGWSPASTNRFARSESVFSTSSFQPTSQTMVQTRGASVVPSDTTAHIYRHSDDASSHPFLKWATYRDASAPWAAQTCIRHANIVSFSFRVLLMPNFHEDARRLLSSSSMDEDMRAPSLDLLEAFQTPSYSVRLRRRHVWELATYWLGKDMPPYGATSATTSDEVIKAAFFFRTGCEPRSWQIEREVCCVVSTFTGTEDESRPDEEFLQNQRHQTLVALVQARNIFGKESVSCALTGFTLVLRHPHVGENQLRWARPSSEESLSVHEYANLFSCATGDSNRSRLQHHHSMGLQHLRQADDVTEVTPFLPPISQDAGRAGAMIAVRPGSWPAECPRFCLFVLSENGVDDKARLGGLLHNAIQDRNYYFTARDVAQGKPNWSQSDWKLLEDWEAHFQR